MITILKVLKAVYSFCLVGEFILPIFYDGEALKGELMQLPHAKSITRSELCRRSRLVKNNNEWFQTNESGNGKGPHSNDVMTI